jgi:hypothetical protein
MNNSSLIQNITNLIIQNITNSTIQNITNQTIPIPIQLTITVSPTPTITSNQSININLSASGTQTYINNTNVTNSPNVSSINMMITPIYSQSPLPNINSTESNPNTNNNNLINFNNPYAISIGFGIIFGIILMGLLYSYFCMKKNNIKERELDDKFILPSMSYSPKSPNHSKVKSIFQR